MLCLFIPPHTLTPLKHWSFYYLHSFASSIISYSWNHTVCYFRSAFSLSNMHSGFPCGFFLFPGLINHCFFIIWICHNLFIFSPLEGHIGCFQVLAIMNKAAINIICRFLCEHSTSTYLVKYQNSTIAGPYHKSMFCLVRNHQTAFQSSYIILYFY